MQTTTIVSKVSNLIKAKTNVSKQTKQNGVRSLYTSLYSNSKKQAANKTNLFDFSTSNKARTTIFSKNLNKLFNVGIVRPYATNATQTNGTLQMAVDHGNYKLPVPLPSKGTHVFSMHEDKEIVTFILDVRSEDHDVKNVAVYNTNGDKIAKSTPVTDLLRDDFVVKINDKTYYIKAPPRSKVGDRYVSVNTDVDSPVFKKIQDMFVEKSKTQESIPYSQFKTFAEDLGVKHEDSKTILKTLHKLGVILYFDSNPELKDTILLRPQQVADQVEKALDLPRLKLGVEQLKAKVAEIKAELAKMDESKDVLDAKAARVINVLAYTVLGLLFAQFALFFRLTWWEFSWDVIEPVTWFTTVNETMLAAYLYYLFTKKEYANTDVRTALIKRRFLSLAQRNGFDVKKYEDLQKQLQTYETELKYAH